jgi:hypothetical protein
MGKCGNVEIGKCGNWKMWKLGNGKWGNGKMGKWGNEHDLRKLKLAKLRQTLLICFSFGKRMNLAYKSFPHFPISPFPNFHIFMGLWLRKKIIPLSKSLKKILSFAVRFRVNGPVA